MVGGFKLTVNLPMTKGSIANPLYSERAASYWEDKLNTSPMWSLPIVEVAKLVWNRGNIHPSNMSNEAYTGVEKNYDSQIRKTHGHTMALIHERLTRSMEEGRLLSKLYKEFPAKMANRIERQNKKESKNQKKVSENEEGMNADNSEVCSDEEDGKKAGMRWGRKKAGVKITLEACSLTK